ncbi:MAG TPA: alkaline phosphatase family protein, partial [Gemmatimonadaceae bacterium]|nr:alkaline phosphatase family protein [Gemmatimonadaceae bacterium]
MSAARVVATLAIVVSSVASAACSPPSSSGGASSAAARARPYVLVVSLDAFRHDYLDRYHLPVLDRIGAAGIRADALVPPFPSKT